MALVFNVLGSLLFYVTKKSSSLRRLIDNRKSIQLICLFVLELYSTLKHRDMAIVNFVMWCSMLWHIIIVLFIYIYVEIYMLYSRVFFFSYIYIFFLDVSIHNLVWNENHVKRTFQNTRSGKELKQKRRRWRQLKWWNELFFCVSFRYYLKRMNQ